MYVTLILQKGFGSLGAQCFCHQGTPAPRKRDIGLGTEVSLCLRAVVAWGHGGAAPDLERGLCRTSHLSCTRASLLAPLWRVITVLASRGVSVIPGQGAAPASQKSSAAQISGEEQGGKQCSAPSMARPQQRMLKGLAGSWAAVPIALQGTGRVAPALLEGTRCLFPS